MKAIDRIKIKKLLLFFLLFWQKIAFIYVNQNVRYFFDII